MENGHVDLKKHYKEWPNAGAFNTLGDQRSPVELQVTGHIPALAVGTLYRTGPGGYKVRRTEGDKENFACSHWFDGFTTVHKFDIVLNGNKSKVVYSSYCQVDELIERARRTGRMNVMSFGQKRDPCDSLYKKFKSIFMPPFPNPTPHSSNVGVTFRETLPTEKALAESASRRLLTVATDTHQTKTFDADTLEPLGLAVQSQLHPDLTGPFSGAHAAHDPETGDVFNYNLSPGRKAVYRVFRASLSGKVEILAEISGHDIHAAYLHSMFITADFLVLCIWPAFYRYMGLSVLWHRNMLDAIEPFDSSSKATWVVVDRKHGRGVVKKFTTPGFFSFHTINAWQEKQKDGVLDIICELAQFDSLDILHTFYYENMVSNESHVGTTGEKLRSKLAGGIARHRLSGIPLSGNSTSTTEAEKIMNIAFPNAGDLPRINPQYALKQHRYVYSVATRHRSSFMDGLVKTDAVKGTSLFWEQDKHTPSEPVFIPTPGDGLDEDDGVILSVIFDGIRSTSYLICLNARTMEELGRADVERPVGLTFHGVHMPKLS